MLSPGRRSPPRRPLRATRGTGRSDGPSGGPLRTGVRCGRPGRRGRGARSGPGRRRRPAGGTGSGRHGGRAGTRRSAGRSVRRPSAPSRVASVGIQGLVAVHGVGVVSKATAPRGPAVGTSSGGRPARPPSASANAPAETGAASRGASWSAGGGRDRPAVGQRGLRDRAASPGLSAATRKTWPPASEKPQTASLSGSTSAAGGVPDRGVPVGDLLPDTDDLARRPPLSPKRR